MFKYIKLSFIIIILFTILGCSDSDESTINKEINKKISVEKNKTKEETLLQEIGFEIQGKKIIIDLNKTNNFFSIVEKKIDKKAKEIETKIKKADINITRDSGVIITENRFSVDLNNSKSLLNDISNLFEEIILDINKSIN